MILEDISVFLQVVSNGSLSRAARAMRRPKASVSHQLKRLETELGTPLFLRTANQMTLNDAGRDFLEHAHSIRRACEQALDATKNSQSLVGGKINIATSSEFASNLMAPILMHFMQTHSNLDVDVMVFQRDTLAEVREQYDCILYLGDPPLPQFASMSARLLGRFSYGLYASGEYLKSHGTPDHPNKLLSHNLLGFHDGRSVTTWHLTSGKEKFSVQPDTKLLSNDYWVVKLSAIHDHGICFVPAFFAKLEERAGLLECILPKWSSQYIPVYALFWSHRFANPNIRSLIDTLSDNFEEVYSYLYTAKRREKKENQIEHNEM